MPANQYGIDMSEIYRTTAAVKGARTANKLAELDLSEKKYDIAQRPARLAKEAKLTKLRGTAAFGEEGSVSAQQQLLSLDPEGAPAFIQAIETMNQTQRDAAKRSVDEMGRVSSYITQGQTPEEQARRYEAFRAGASPDMQAKLPEQYDPQFMQLSLSKALTMDQLLEAPKVVSAGKNEQQYRLGKKIGTYAKPVTKGKGGTGGPGGGVKSTDESLMYKMSGELLGGIFDQSGNLTNLDPETRNKIQSVSTEAANLFREKGNITRSEAVKRSAKKFGFNINDAPDNSNAGSVDNDPLGLL